LYGSDEVTFANYVRVLSKKKECPLGDEVKAIGLTGPFRSGCTTAAEHLGRKADFSVIRLSDPVKAEWKKHHPSGSPTRHELQDIGDELRRVNGNHFLVSSQLPAAKGKVVFDGIKNVGEIDFLRQKYGYNFTLFGIIPTNAARQDRIGGSMHPEDLRNFFADDLRDQDEETTYGQEVRKCIDQADVLVDNSDLITLGEYKRKVLEFANLAIGIKFRPPSRTEIFMNMAYSACHSSRCLKRHVGAVVVDQGGNAVGVGYNENPRSTQPCAIEYSGDCFKDRHKRELIKQLFQVENSLYCPCCGTRIEITDIENAGRIICPGCAKKGRRSTVADLLFPERGMTYCTAIHAEAWALISAGERARGGELFCTTYPCLQCAEKIAHAGVRTIWFTEPYPEAVSGKRLEIAQVELKQFEGVRCFDRMFARGRVS
jgi:deoxycytidylate deaminase